MDKKEFLARAICNEAKGDLKILVNHIAFSLCVAHSMMKKNSTSRMYVLHTYDGDIDGAFALAYSLGIISFEQRELFQARAKLLLLRITGGNEYLKPIYQKILHKYSSKC